MNTLFLDTSTDYAIAGICTERGELLASVAERHDRQLSVRLYPMFERVLESVGIRRKDIDALCVGLGPGSFTGVRIAVTTMRTLAQALQIPLFAYGTLDAFAESARVLHPEIAEHALLTLLPSRRDEVYSATYQPGQIHADSKALSYSEAREITESRMDVPITVIGPAALLAALFPQTPENQTNTDLVTLEHPSADAIAKLTQQAYESKEWRNPLSLDPMYVVPPAVSQHKTGRL